MPPKENQFLAKHTQERNIIFLLGKKTKGKSMFKEVLLTKENLERIRILLEKQRPRSLQIFNICKLLEQELLPPRVIPVSLYEYSREAGENEEDIEEEDPFIVCFQRPNMLHKTSVIILPPQNPTPAMLHSFDNLLPWTEPILFQSCPRTFWESYLKPLCISHSGHASGKIILPLLYVLEKDVALLKETPSKGISPQSGDEYTLNLLAEEDLSILLSNWDYEQPHSGDQMRALLKYLPAAGLYVKNGESGKLDELACSLLMSAYGCMNILFTEEHHRGNGYAKLVILWLAKVCAEKMGLDGLMDTMDENVATIAVFNKCGFKPVQRTVFYWYEPKNE